MDVTESREIHVILLILLPRLNATPDHLSFLILVERYFFFRGLLNYRYVQKHAPLNLSVDILALIGKRDAVEQLRHKLSEQLVLLADRADFPEAFIEGLSESGFYSWRDLKYFMYEYELHLKEKAKRKSDKVEWRAFISDDEDDHSSIEHILPQTPSDPYWKNQLKSFTQGQVKKLTNSLGNLLGISAGKNSSLRNGAFTAKIGSADSKTGYRFGSYSENEVALSPHWGPAEILKRGLVLLEFLEVRWEIPFGDEARRKKCLGLDFMP